MDPATRLGADELRAAIRAYAEVLDAHREALDRLNVYPVPDSDTGTNLALTVASIVAELEAVEAEGTPDMATTCRSVGHGALMGARGNSGLILSQVLRGLAEEFADRETAGPHEMAAALARGAEAARRAVATPVEGTILTVARVAGDAAIAAAAAGEGLTAVLDGARVAGGDALARTRDQLPALTRAQVVDAGGAGYTLLVDALLSVVDGRRLPDPGAVPWAPPAAAETEVPAAEASGEPAADHAPDPPVEAWQSTGPRFEVMCRLEASEEAIPILREAWVVRGESVVIAGGGSSGEGGVAWSCHVHTDDIGAVLQAALDAGRPRDLRVVDLAGGGHQAPVRPAAGAEDREAPGEALTLVVTGEVTRAVRASEGVAGSVAVGDWLGLSAGRIEVVEAAGPAEAACGLLAKLCRDDHRRVILVEGAGVATADTRRVREWLAAHCPWAAVEVHHGGQRRHPYLVSIE